MRLAVLALILLLSACDGVIPAGGGRYVSRATATSDTDNPNQRAHDQAEAFCKARGQPLVIETTAGGIRPPPESWSVHFRCGYPSPAQVPVVPAPVALPPSIPVPAPAVPDPFPAAAPAGQLVAAGKRYAVVVSFGSLASGTDPVAEKAFEVQVKALEAEVGHALQRRVRHWGREGEYDVCLDLSDVEASQRLAFAQALREGFRSSDRTGLKEEAVCGD
jgi:hypothetical protein